MLQPTRTKYRRQQRGRHKGKASSGYNISFGEYGLSAVGRGIINGNQIESARIAMSRHIKRAGKIWIRVFPDIPYTKKPAETRMGKGKGAPESWIFKVKPGRVLFEIAGVERELAKEAMERAAAKLSFKCEFFVRGEMKI